MASAPRTRFIWCCRHCPASAFGDGPDRRVRGARRRRTAPDGLPEDGRATFDRLASGITTGGRAYFAMLTARPQNMGDGMADSPAGLAAWMLVHGGFTQWTSEDDAERSPTKDEVLDDITLYWLTNTGASAGRIYWHFAAWQEPQLFSDDVRTAFRSLG